MFDKIVSYENLKSAYLDIVEKFEVDSKNFRYHGLDNILIGDLNLYSEKLIDICQKELLEKKEIDPALLVRIPKKNNPEKYREIFIYNIKERIKAQAIYRVVLPEFEKLFSDRLFSYRPGKPPYFAGRIFCHRYRKHFQTDYALILDLENYFGYMDKDILYSQLQKVFDDKKVLDLLGLFIFNTAYKDGSIEPLKVGMVNGVPLIPLFANLYITDIDHKYNKKSEFYIRIGDDIGIFDKNIEKLKQIKEDLFNDLKNKKVPVNINKLFFGKASQEFSFLRYNFNLGIISLEKSYLRSLELGWKKILSHKHLNKKQKISLFKKLMSRNDQNFNYQFQTIIRSKPQINNSEQIKRLSEIFFHVLTEFMYEKYSLRNRRLLESDIKNIGIKSLYYFYKKFHYERNKKTN